MHFKNRNYTVEGWFSTDAADFGTTSFKGWPQFPAFNDKPEHIL